MSRGVACATALGAVQSAVHHALQECARSEHHGAGAELDTHLRTNAHNTRTCTLSTFANTLILSRFARENQLRNAVLPQVQTPRIFERTAPLGRKFGLVALSTRAPHCGSLRAVEHTELDGREVGDSAHLTAQCVDLAHDLTLSHATHCGVARHRGELAHIHRDKQRARAQIGRRSRRLATRVATAHNYDIVLGSHRFQ